jgi:hypothetical protein
VAFSLTKWYLDLVTEEGDVAIAYWAEVGWGRLHQPLCGLLLRRAGAAAEPWRFSRQRTGPPVLAGGGLCWRAEPLALQVEMEGLEPGYAARLLEGRAGMVEWRCEIPRARVRLRAGEMELEGEGYAERIELTLPPWQIPAREIRWGRFLAEDRSVVWIEWRGEHPLRLVFHDGRLTPATGVAEEGMGFGAGFELALEEPRVVSDDLLGGLLAPLEKLRPVIEPIARTRQTRWLSRGTLRAPGVEPVRGWALHELVTRA